MTNKPSVEERARALFQAAGPSEPMSPEALANVWKKTEPKLGPSFLRPLSKVLLVAAAAIGAWWFTASRPRPLPMLPAATAVEAPVTGAPVAVAKPVTEEAAEAVGAGPITAPTTQPLPAAPRIKPAVVPPVAEVPRSDETEDPLLAESKLIAHAVSLLRVQHDAAGALSTLDEHAHRFSSGVLVREAQLVRVEALATAGQREAALRLLESMPLAEMPRGEELRVLKGELLAETGRCTEAVRELERALGTTLVREAEDRALYRRATCLPPAEQRAELEKYLGRFPTGRFADAARSQLEP